MDVAEHACPCGCHRNGAASCNIVGGCTDLHAHRCRRGGRCGEHDWADTIEPDNTTSRVRIGALINSDVGLCLSCVRHFDTAIGELGRDYVELNLLLARGLGMVLDEGVSGSRDLPVPIRLHVEALQRGIVWEVSCWAEVVAERLNIDWDTGPTRPGRVVDRATRLLGSPPARSVLLAVRDWPCLVWNPDGTDATVECRDGVDGAVALLDLHHQARRLAGLTRLVHRMPVPCPRCERLALHCDDGDDTVYCGACWEQYTAEDYAQLESSLAGSVAV